MYYNFNTVSKYREIKAASSTNNQLSAYKLDYIYDLDINLETNQFSALSDSLTLATQLSMYDACCSIGLAKQTY